MSVFGGGGWIRTTVGIASRFTVCPLWPLGNTPVFGCAAGMTENRSGCGAGGRIRTPDLLITNQLLYRLSYTSRFPAGVIITKPERFVNRKIRSSGNSKGAGSVPPPGLLLLFRRIRGVAAFPAGSLPGAGFLVLPYHVFKVGVLTAAGKRGFQLVHFRLHGGDTGVDSFHLFA